MSGDLNHDVIALKSYYDSLRPIVQAGYSQRISFAELKAHKEHLEQMFMDVGQMERNHIDMDQMMFLQRKYQEVYKQLEYASRSQVNKQELEKNLMKILSEQTNSFQELPSKAQLSTQKMNTMPEVIAAGNRINSSQGIGGPPMYGQPMNSAISPPMLVIPTGPQRMVNQELRHSGIVINNQQLLPMRNSQTGGALSPIENSQQFGDRSAHFPSGGSPQPSNVSLGLQMPYMHPPQMLNQHVSSQNPSFGSVHPEANNEAAMRRMMGTTGSNFAPSAPVTPLVDPLTNLNRWSGVLQNNPWNNKNPWATPATITPPAMASNQLPSSASGVVDPWNNREPWSKPTQMLNPPLMRKDSQESIVAKLSEGEMSPPPKHMSGIKPNNNSNSMFPSVDLLPKPNTAMAPPLILPQNYDSPMPQQINQSEILPQPMRQSGVGTIQNSPNFGQPIPIMGSSTIPVAKTTQNTIDKAAASLVGQNIMSVIPINPPMPPSQSALLPPRIEQTTSYIIPPDSHRKSQLGIPLMNQPLPPSRPIESSMRPPNQDLSMLQSNLNNFFSSVNQKRKMTFKSQMNMEANKRPLSPISQRLRSHHRQQQQSALQRLTTQNQILKSKLRQNEERMLQNNKAMINTSQQYNQSLLNKSSDGVAIQTSQLQELRKIRQLNDHLKNENVEINRKMDELRDIMEELAKENQQLKEMSRSIQKSAPRRMGSHSSSSSLIRQHLQQDPERRIEIRPNIKPIEYVQTFSYGTRNVPVMPSIPSIPSVPSIPSGSQQISQFGAPQINQKQLPQLYSIRSQTPEMMELNKQIRLNRERQLAGVRDFVENTPQQPQNISYSLYINQASLMESINQKKTPVHYIMQQRHNDLNKVNISTSVDYEIPRLARMNQEQQLPTVREEMVMPPHYIEEVQEIYVEPLNEFGQPQTTENTTVQKRINNGKLEEVVTTIEHFPVSQGSNGEIIIPMKEVGPIEIPKETLHLQETQVAQVTDFMGGTRPNQQTIVNYEKNKVVGQSVQQGGRTQGSQVLQTSAVQSVKSFVGSASQHSQNFQRQINQIGQINQNGQKYAHTAQQVIQASQLVQQGGQQPFRQPVSQTGQQMVQQVQQAAYDMQRKMASTSQIPQPIYPVQQSSQMPQKPMTASTNVNHMSSKNSQPYTPTNQQYISEEPPQIPRHNNDSMERSFETFKIAEAANSYSVGSFDLKPMQLPKAIPNMNSSLLTRNKVAFFKKSLVLVRSQNFDIAFKKSQLNNTLDMIRLILYIDNKKGIDTPVSISYEYEQSLYRLIVKEKLNNIRPNQQGRQQLLISLIDDKRSLSCIVCHIKISQVIYDILLPVLFLRFIEGISQFNETDLKTVQIIAHQQFSNPINLQKLMPLTYLNDEEEVQFLKNEKPYKSEIVVQAKKSKNSLKIDWFRGIITLTGSSKYTQIIAFILSDISIR